MLLLTFRSDIYLPIYGYLLLIFCADTLPTIPIIPCTDQEIHPAQKNKAFQKRQQQTNLKRSRDRIHLEPDGRGRLITTFPTRTTSASQDVGRDVQRPQLDARPVHRAVGREPRVFPRVHILRLFDAGEEDEPTCAIDYFGHDSTLVCTGIHTFAATNE